MALGANGSKTKITLIKTRTVLSRIDSVADSSSIIFCFKTKRLLNREELDIFLSYVIANRIQQTVFTKESLMDMFVILGGDCLKEKECDVKDKDLKVKAEDEEAPKEIELDVKKEIDKIAEIINNVKETALKMKGAEVKVKDWSLLVTYSEGEYLVDFKMKISIKPDKM